MNSVTARITSPFRPQPSSLFILVLFGGGGFFLKRYGDGASGGFPFKKGNDGILKCTKVSYMYFIIFSSISKGVHPRHPPRTFPLWLLAPRCLGLARFLALRHCGAGARAPAVWGKEGILPPASPRLGRARPTGSHNPHPRFHIHVLWCRFRY